MADLLLKSAYEIARDQRLKRNQQVMATLGLPVNEVVEEDQSPKGKKNRPQQAPLEPTRQSKRVRGLGPDGQVLPEKVKPPQHEDFETEDENMKRRIQRLKSLHLERNSGYTNPTATYEHTWMRVRTMSDKALLNRVKVIENRAGKDCLVKMRMFAEVLLLADKLELGQTASEALDRLLVESGAEKEDGDEDEQVFPPELVSN